MQNSYLIGSQPKSLHHFVNSRFREVDEYSFERVEKFKYLVSIITSKNDIDFEIN